MKLKSTVILVYVIVTVETSLKRIGPFYTGNVCLVSGLVFCALFILNFVLFDPCSLSDTSFLIDC